MTTTSDAGAGIVLSGLGKSHGAVPAVRGLDPVIAPSETVAPLGPRNRAVAVRIADEDGWLCAAGRAARLHKVGVRTPT